MFVGGEVVSRSWSAGGEASSKVVTGGATSSRASNEGSRRFYNHREGAYLGLLLVKSTY